LINNTSLESGDYSLSDDIKYKNYFNIVNI